jgi:hypothetical protein
VHQQYLAVRCKRHLHVVGRLCWAHGWEDVNACMWAPGKTVVGGASRADVCSSSSVAGAGFARSRRPAVIACPVPALCKRHQRRVCRDQSRGSDARKAAQPSVQKEGGSV